MTKRASRPTRAGQLAGVQIKIIGVYNHGLREHIAIANQGTRFEIKLPIVEAEEI